MVIILEYYSQLFATYRNFFSVFSQLFMGVGFVFFVFLNPYSPAAKHAGSTGFPDVLEHPSRHNLRNWDLNWKKS